MTITTHSPADVLAQLLVDLGVGSGTLTSDWATFATKVVDKPDRVLVVSDTQGRTGGRTNPDRNVREKPGVQFMIRGRTAKEAWDKCKQVVAFIDSVYDNTVRLDESRYSVHCITRTGTPLPVGQDSPQSARYLVSVNCLVTLKQLS